MYFEVKANKTDVVKIRIDKINQEYKCTKIDVIIHVHRDGAAIG